MKTTIPFTIALSATVVLAVDIRCRMQGQKFVYVGSLLSLSTLSLYFLLDIMSHSQIILHHNVFMTGFALCLCLSLSLSVSSQIFQATA